MHRVEFIGRWFICRTMFNSNSIPFDDDMLSLYVYVMLESLNLFSFMFFIQSQPEVGLAWPSLGDLWAF